MSAITRWIPKNHLSYLAGKFVHLRLPSLLNALIIKNFARYYRINLDEAELPYDQYPSLGEFFVRKLKSGVRSLGSTWALHPADSVITQASALSEGKLIQAKGKAYDVNEFVGSDQAFQDFTNGGFLTYYLCPTDYHRVHSPVSGEIVKVRYLPGNLWPVNNWSTTNVENLFSINERVWVEIKTDRGLVGVMFVGATNVGQIILSFDPSIVGNQLKTEVIEKTYSGLKIQKGDELGMFRMGSTIVMLYSEKTININSLTNFINKAVKVRSDFLN